MRRGLTFFRPCRGLLHVFAAIIFGLAFCLLAAQSGNITFTDITAASGIHFKHEASKTSEKYLIETMGSGVAVFDFDNDGWLDVFFVNGARLADPMPKGAAPDKRESRYFDRLYRNNGNGTFTDVTEKAGVKGSYYEMGVAVGDYDNDGFQDLYVTGFGRNTLYHNNGNGTFTDVTDRADVGAGGWSASAGWFDYDNDGKLDLFVCRYMVWDFSMNLYCGDHKPGYRAYCHPSHFKAISSLLFHNNADGTFTDVSQKSGIASVPGKALGVAFIDYDHDGWIDICVANDSVAQQLFHNKGDGTFQDVALGAGVGYDENGKSFAGMGIDCADYDNDGWPDIFITDLSNELYALFHNSRDGTFSYATTESGVGHATRLYSGWSTRFLDFDHDGLKDIWVAQGHVLDTIQLTAGNLRYLEPPLMLKNAGGKFVDVSTSLGKAFAQPWAGRGAAFGDLDNDGDIDIVVSNSDQSAYVMRNDGGNTTGNWLMVRAEGTKSNRDGIGAQIKVVSSSGLAQYATVNTAVGYCSSSDRRVHFGLGRDSSASLEIHWPSGITQKVDDVRANQVLVVKETGQSPPRGNAAKPQPKIKDRRSKLNSGA
ncbi:MAG TPA: CRTAC1 family protein [Acidobacteriota bacterium]|nr:CRTAC1 family protein [Acidobacteriota bacterium]